MNLDPLALVLGHLLMMFGALWCLGFLVAMILDFVLRVGKHSSMFLLYLYYRKDLHRFLADRRQRDE